MNPTRPCNFKVGDEVLPTSPDYMTDCIGTVTSISYRPIAKSSNRWEWKVYIKLHKPYISSPIHQYIIKVLIRSDIELTKARNRFSV